MLKHVLMTGAMLMAVPAVAQTAPQTTPATPPAPTTATPPAPTTPQPPEPAAPPAEPAAAPAAPAAPGDPVADAPAPTAPAAPAAPAAADAAPAPAPVAPVAATAPAPVAPMADIIGKEFPSYDKNHDGKLSKAEFGAWMFALRKASDPALKDDAANQTYVAGAFKTADTDKSSSVSKDELTNYLSQGQNASK